mgnify:CR=1 FL=1
MFNIKGQNLVCEDMIVITNEQKKKLENSTLQKVINNIQAEMDIEARSIRENGNISMSIISTTCDGYDNHQQHDLEIKHINFLRAVDQLEVPEEEVKPKYKTKDAQLAFVQELYHDLNSPIEDDRHVHGALVIDTTTHPFFQEITGWGRISGELLNEFCKLYIEANS